MGNPVEEEKTCPDNVGTYRHYENGSIHYHPKTGARATWGGIRNVWATVNWESSFLGYPKEDECDLDLSKFRSFFPEIHDSIENRLLGRISYFQGGAIIYWSDHHDQHTSKQFLIITFKDRWKAVITKEDNEYFGENPSLPESLTGFDIPTVDIADLKPYKEPVIGYNSSSKQIGDFELIEKIGSGGCADIWKCINSVTSELRAIKIFNLETSRQTDIVIRGITEYRHKINDAKSPYFMPIEHVGRSEKTVYYIITNI